MGNCLTLWGMVLRCLIVAKRVQRRKRYLLYGIPIYIFLVLVALVPIDQLALGIIRASGAIFLLGFLTLCIFIAHRDRSMRR